MLDEQIIDILSKYKDENSQEIANIITLLTLLKES